MIRIVGVGEHVSDYEFVHATLGVIRIPEGNYWLREMIEGEATEAEWLCQILAR